MATRIGQVVGPAEWGWGGVGHALGFNYITPRLGPGCKESGAAWGRFGPSGAEYGRLGLSGAGEGLDMHWDSIKLLWDHRVGPVRAEWGWGRVGHALGFNKITLRLRISTKALGFN